MASDFKAEARPLPDLTLCLTSVEWQIARFAPQPSTPVNRQLPTVYSAQKCTYAVSVPKGGGRENNANGGVGNVPPQTGNADYRLSRDLPRRKPVERRSLVVSWHCICHAGEILVPFFFFGR